MEAIFRAEGCTVDFTAAAAITAGQMFQVPDGRAGFSPVGVSSGQLASAQVYGLVEVLKAASVVMLKGQRIYWDASANVATFRKVNSTDYYIGRCAADAAAADTTVKVHLNVDPEYTIDLHKTAFESIPVGTAAAGGFGYPKVMGGAFEIELTGTSEAQKIDLLSVDRFDISGNAIVEAEIRLAANGSTSAVDLNIGVANGTHATDADSITESVFFHIDGGALDILAESDDGTTEVAATDTTVDATAGSAVANRLFFQIDMRNPADIQLYIDGVNVLPSSVFTLAGATGPMGLLVHLEKTTGTATGSVVIDNFRAYLTDTE